MSENSISNFMKNIMQKTGNVAKNGAQETVQKADAHFVQQQSASIFKELNGKNQISNVQKTEIIDNFNVLIAGLKKEDENEKAIQDRDETEKKLDKAREEKREEDYGVNIGELPEKTIEKMMDDYVDAVMNDSVKTSEPEEGVTVTEFGDWIQTEIELYGGEKYSELSEEEQKSVDEYNEKMDKWNSLSDEEKAMLDEPVLPEGLEKETEVRVENKNGDLKTKNEEPNLFTKLIKFATGMFQQKPDLPDVPLDDIPGPDCIDKIEVPDVPLDDIPEPNYTDKIEVPDVPLDDIPEPDFPIDDIPEPSINPDKDVNETGTKKSQETELYRPMPNVTELEKTEEELYEKMTEKRAELKEMEEEFNEIRKNKSTEIQKKLEEERSSITKSYFN